MKQRHETKVNPKLFESVIVPGFRKPGIVSNITRDGCVSVRLGGMQARYIVKRKGKQLVAMQQVHSHN